MKRPRGGMHSNIEKPVLMLTLDLALPWRWSLTWSLEPGSTEPGDSSLRSQSGSRQYSRASPTGMVVACWHGETAADLFQFCWPINFSVMELTMFKILQSLTVEIQFAKVLLFHKISFIR